MVYRIDKILFAFTALWLSAPAEAGFLDKIQDGLDRLNENLTKQQQENAEKLAARQPINPVVSAKRKTTSTIVYSGYSAKFLPVKQLIYDGKLSEAERFYATLGEISLPEVRNSYKQKIDRSETNESDKDISLNDESLGFLNALEHGSLLLDSGQSKSAIDKFAEAERIIEMREEEGTVTEKAKSVFTNIVGTILGNDELSRYDGEGFEKVLMLNYQSIGYLLNGDRRAYNVARKAMDWQQIEERKFQEELLETEKKLAQERQNEQASEGGADSASQALNQQLKRFEDRANEVASAYVNPFGWYINAMILEFESYQDSSLWSNARIAYKNAYDLNPSSQVIKRALADTKKRTAPKKGKRIVHMLVADGFAPEKKTILNEINTEYGPVDLRLPLYEPVSNPVNRVEIRDRLGNKITTFSTIADIEAIALRHQKDSEPVNKLRSLLGFIRGVGQAKALSQAGTFGVNLNQSVKKLQTLDTRSWMSLPSRIQGARFYLNKNVKTLQIVSLDKKGKVIGKKKVKLNGNPQEFVYVRSINGDLLVQYPDMLWLKGG